VLIPAASAGYFLPFGVYVEIPDGGSAIPVFHDSRGRDISALLASLRRVAA
jgi:hypothetical protein